jgi:hypothetical protein
MLKNFKVATPQETAIAVIAEAKRMIAEGKTLNIMEQAILESSYYTLELAIQDAFSGVESSEFKIN